MQVDHIGIAVEDIQVMLDFYKTIGLEVKHQEEVPSQGVKVAMLPLGHTKLELLEPLSEESPIYKFIQKKGTGIHHVALEVDDIEKSLATLKDKGFKLINETPVQGAGGAKIAFIHPKSAGGVLYELCQHS